jgi:hypothetical protein
LVGMAGLWAMVVVIVCGDLPRSFEWPAGYEDGIELTPQGLYLVPLQFVNRLQIYDRNLKFGRGWHIPAIRGSFEVYSSQPGRIDVFATRGSKHFVYSETGDLLASGDITGKERAALRGHGFPMLLPTRWWQWPFASPILSICMTMIGWWVMLKTYKISRSQPHF